MKKKERKTHIFEDCSGHYYSQDSDVIFTSKLEEVTYGQCKGQLLQTLQAKDWKTLSEPELDVLENIMLK